MLYRAIRKSLHGLARLIWIAALGACGRIGFEITEPRCVGMTDRCGDSATSCCDSRIVHGDTFLRGYDVAADGTFSDASHPATVSDFRLDTYEVTVGRFRAFVASGHGTQLDPPADGSGAHPRLLGSGWAPEWTAALAPDSDSLSTNLVSLQCAGYATWAADEGTHETRPINCVSWATAMAFCIWDGGYLPTEAEWNFAASGGSEHRVFPWTSTSELPMIDGEHASYSDGTDCVGDGLPGCMITDLITVGTKPNGAGRWGHMDLAGNVSEWVLDVHVTPLPDPCVNCAHLATGEERGLRGGSFIRDIILLRPAARGNSRPEQISVDSGFRCARPVS